MLNVAATGTELYAAYWLTPVDWTPGVCDISSMTLFTITGRSITSRLVSTRAEETVLVSSNGPAAVTETVSASEPSSRWTETSVAPPIVNTTPDRTNFLNPDASTVTV